MPTEIVVSKKSNLLLIHAPENLAISLLKQLVNYRLHVNSIGGDISKSVSISDLDKLFPKSVSQSNPPLYILYFHPSFISGRWKTDLFKQEITFLARSLNLPGNRFIWCLPGNQTVYNDLVECLKKAILPGINLDYRTVIFSDIYDIPDSPEAFPLSQYFASLKSRRLLHQYPDDYQLSPISLVNCVPGLMTTLFSKSLSHKTVQLKGNINFAAINFGLHLKSLAESYSGLPYQIIPLSVPPPDPVTAIDHTLRFSDRARYNKHLASWLSSTAPYPQSNRPVKFAGAFVTKSIPPEIIHTRRLRGFLLRKSKVKPSTVTNPNPDRVKKHHRFFKYFMFSTIFFTVIILLIILPFIVVFSGSRYSSTLKGNVSGDICRVIESITANSAKASESILRSALVIRTPLITRGIDNLSGTLELKSLKLNRDLSLCQFIDHSQQLISKLADGGVKVGDLIAAETFLERAYLKDQDLQSVTSKPQSVNTENALSDKLKSVIMVIPAIHELLLSPVTKTMLLIVQDDQELRPTGGFIESLVPVSFSSGKVVVGVGQSVYSLDSRLSGLVKPPPDLESTLKEPQWFLRDANWSPDFSVSAQQIAWFYEKETDTPVDLVATINRSSLLRLKAILSKSDIPVTKESISNPDISSAENISQSGPNLDILDISLLNSSTLQELAASSLPQKVVFFDSFLNALKNKDIQIWSKNASLNRSLITNHWLSVLPPPCPISNILTPCQNDFIGVTETNIGLNQINPYIFRKQSHTINFQPDEIIHRHQIDLTNMATGDSYPVGDYRLYLRFALPVNAKLVGISGNLQEIPQENLTLSSTQNYQLIGAVVTLPVNHRLTLVANYSVPWKLAGQNTTSYQFSVIKQSGINGSPLEVALTSPELFKIKPIFPSPGLPGTSWILSTVLDSDILLQVDLLPGV